MWDIFEVVDPNSYHTLFPPHELGRLLDPETGRPIDPLGGTVYPRPIDVVDRPLDHHHLSEMLPDRQYGDRDADRGHAMIQLQTDLNNGNRNYLDAMRRTGTPPNGYFSGFNISLGPPTGHSHAVSHSKLRSMSKSQSPSVIEFEWDSDSSHHFTGIKSHFLPDTFVSKRMKVRVASEKIHYAEGYGQMGHPMLGKV